MTGYVKTGRRHALGVAAVLALATGLAATPAAAQVVVITANDSPITNYDIAQRSRLLGVLHAPSGQQAAVESLIKDRLRLIETRKFGINPGEQEIAQEAAREAGEHKITPQALGAGLQRARIDKSHWQEHWRAELSWRVLVQAMNKSVNVSEDEVRAEMQRKGSKAGNQEYQLQQVELVVPRTASVAAWNDRFREATGLRARFRDCKAGIQLARALRDVAVQPPFNRRASSLNPQLVATLDRTPVGQLSMPQRGPTGIVMIAVCGKSNASGSGASDSVRDELLVRKLKADSEKRYLELRKRAVIVKRH